MAERVFICGIGAITPIGRGAWESAAAVRAGVSGFCQHPYMIDTAGEPMKACIASWLDIDLRGADRFEALLMPAIEEALDSIVPARYPPAGRFALALALPSPRPGLDKGLAKDLVRRVQAIHGAVFGSVAVIETGHAAGLLAVRAAVKKLESGALDACLVAGVDSYIEPETLEWLEACDQLHGAGPLNNAWGFIPGEAGAALLLLREGAMKADGLRPFACVLSTGEAFEFQRIKTGTVCIGEGLTAAFRSALAALPNEARVTDIYCDMNGEPYRADEFGFSALRTKERFESAGDFVAPADCWGDVCSASGLLHLLLASVAAHKEYSKGPLVFVFASSEAGHRASALLVTAGGHDHAN